MFEAGQDVWSYVIGAYGVAWLTMIGYSLRLYLVNRRATEDLRHGGGEGS
jgi:hypothetical protein